MGQPVPDWVSFEATQTTGLDLLGLRAPVQSLGNDLFNGITTVTPKLRYMSVITWIVWRYSQARLPDKKPAFMEFAAAQEAMVVMANRMKSKKTTNLVGVEEADRAVDSDKMRLALRKLAQNIAFNAYVASSRQLHLTRQTTTGLNDLSEERGAKLAKEFDKLIKASPYGPRLAKKPRIDSISRADLESLAEHLSLENVPDNESDILIEALLPAEPIDEAERRRMTNYTLLLWLSREAQTRIDETDVYRAAQEPPDTLPRALLSLLDAWLAYLVRDALAVCHEAAFAAVLREVDVMASARQSPALAAEVMASLMDDVTEKDDALRSVRLLKPGESVSSISFRTIHERIQRRCRHNESIGNGLRRWSGGLSETELYDVALKSDAAALALLPVAWSLASRRVISGPDPTPLQRTLLTTGSIYQMGIADIVLPKIEEFLRQDRSYLHVMVELATRTVQQHLRVAWSRLSAPNGKDVSILVADMETWSRNKPFRAGRTDSRLWVALNWLEQLGLIDEDGLTTTGTQTLKRSLTLLGRQ
jgi:hypothetical protein